MTKYINDCQIHIPQKDFAKFFLLSYCSEVNVKFRYTFTDLFFFKKKKNKIAFVSKSRFQAVVDFVIEGFLPKITKKYWK